ncbi:hypothetical protein [Halomonas sp. BM-2019]|uniref:hypothetical protein n=1 Tax=Halomonas sp. BM-2019 TaxID=2811227 RepID=UPI0031FD1CDF
MLPVDPPDDHEAGLIGGFCRNLQQVRIFLEPLGIDKVDTVFVPIRFALVGIEFKGRHV